MNVCLLVGTPRKQGNTASLLKPFTEELEKAGHSCHSLWLYDRKLKPCTACRACQKDWTGFGCPQQDDMQEVFDALLASDLIVLASPIYSWYCTPPMKTVLDRMTYGMNKYYGENRGPSLWAGKKLALITTCGYRPEKGADIWEEGMKRACKNSKLEYLGMLAERHMGYGTIFMDVEKEAHARAFANSLCRKEVAEE